MKDEKICKPLLKHFFWKCRQWEFHQEKVLPLWAQIPIFKWGRWQKFRTAGMNPRPCSFRIIWHKHLTNLIVVGPSDHYLEVFYQAGDVKVFELLEHVEANFFLRVLQNVLEVSEQIPDDLFVLVQHPVPLLVVLLPLRQLLEQRLQGFGVGAEKGIGRLRQCCFAKKTPFWV